ncbi:MAG: type IV secretory system conjugative DNA transfer family protein [Ilumatobacteraceae bacterium]|nr:type IV secretory system conjugative DNA transfer family protein [Ilumatobacteraceae bacterium]
MNERPSSMSAPETLLLVAACAVVALGVVAWSGAALAAMLNGERLDGGLAAAMRALTRLPDHLGDPRMAWRAPEDRAALPGPTLYWAATSCVLLAVLGVVWLGLWVWRRSLDRGRVRLGVETRARFATTRDLAPLVVERPVPTGRFVLGRVHGRFVATEDRHAAAPMRSRRVRVRQGDRGSVAVIGPSRSGKTANVIAGLLDWDGPAVVVSIKRDLIDATREARQTKGATKVFDPSGVSGLPPLELGRWTPLRAARSPRGAQKAASALAASIPRSGVDGGADYWVKQAEILLTGLLGAAALADDRTMLDVAQWVFTKSIPVKKRPNEIIDILRRAKQRGTAAEREAAGAAMLQLDAVWNLDERVRSSVYATVQTVVQAWLDPAVDLSSTLDRSGQRFVDLDWLTDPGRANTLYLVAPLDDQDRLAPVLGGLLGDLKDQAYQRDVAGVGLERPLLMVIDEAGNMPLAWLPEVAATCAGIGILLVTIWQSKAQLDAAYGRLSDSVLTNHLTKVVFSGCSDPATLDYVSRLLGDEEVQHRSLSYDLGGGSRRSVSESSHREALTPFHLLRQVRPGEAVLIHGTLPPAHLIARRWWEERPAGQKAA